jgi:hypothetical protein
MKPEVFVRSAESVDVSAAPAERPKRTWLEALLCALAPPGRPSHALVDGRGRHLRSGERIVVAAGIAAQGRSPPRRAENGELIAKRLGTINARWKSCSSIPSIAPDHCPAARPRSTATLYGRAGRQLFLPWPLLVDFERHQHVDHTPPRSSGKGVVISSSADPRRQSATSDRSARSISSTSTWQPYLS